MYSYYYNLASYSGNPDDAKFKYGHGREYEDLSFEQIIEMAEKMNPTLKKLKAQKRSEARQQKEKMDAVNKLMAEDKSNDNFIEKLHRAEEKYENMKKGVKPENKEEPSPELLAKDKQYKKDYLSNKKNSWTTDKTLKADYDKSGLKKVTDDAYKFYKDMITNIDDSKQKELQKRETKVFESDNWLSEVKFDGDSVRLDVYFMTKPDNAGPLYSYYQKINEKWNQNKGTYDWWASNQVHRENGLKYYNGFNKDADWLKPLNMVRDMF